MIKNFFTPKEVAKLLKVNILTVYEYIKTQKLDAIRIGRNYRVEEGDLEKFLSQHKIVHTN